jgi:hypothetical protein
LRQFALPPTNRFGVEPRDLRDQEHAAISQAHGLARGNQPTLPFVEHVHQDTKVRVMRAIGMVTCLTART